MTIQSIEILLGVLSTGFVVCMGYTWLTRERMKRSVELIYSLMSLDAEAMNRQLMRLDKLDGQGDRAIRAIEILANEIDENQAALVELGDLCGYHPTNPDEPDEEDDVTNSRRTDPAHAADEYPAS